jgi:hypothetical protein
MLFDDLFVFWVSLEYDFVTLNDMLAREGLLRADRRGFVGQRWASKPQVLKFLGV